MAAAMMTMSLYISWLQSPRSLIGWTGHETDAGDANHRGTVVSLFKSIKKHIKPLPRRKVVPGSANTRVAVLSSAFARLAC